jgi:predicted ATPase
MKLLKAEIGGYRNIGRAAISLSKITALVSGSGCGKSNLMSAIAFAARFISAGSGTRHQMMSDASCVPMSRENAGRNFRADFLFLTESMGISCYAEYGFSFEWIRNSGGCRITGEWLTVKEDRKGQRPERLILRGEGESLYRARKDGLCNTRINAGGDGLVLGILLQQDGLYYLELLKELNAFRVYEIRHPDTAVLFSSPAAMERDGCSFDLKERGSIPRLLCELREKYPERYMMLTDAFCQLFPDIEGIDARAMDLREFCGIRPASAPPFTRKERVCSVYVSDANLNQPLDISVLSDGAGRVLLMLTAAVFADTEGYQLLEIGEPENSVHPGLLQNFLNALSQLAGNCRILISTNSPYIVECLSPEALYIGRQESSGHARFSGIKRSKVRDFLDECRRCGESLGGLVFDLLSGCADDRAILSGYLED